MIIHAGLGRREAKLIFTQSQMLVTNELKHRKRAVGLMFFDFLEALARLADFISPPSMEKLLDETMIKAKSSDSDGSNVHPLEYHLASRSGGWIASSSESDHLPTRPDKRISNQPHVNLTQPPESVINPMSTLRNLLNQ